MKRGNITEIGTKLTLLFFCLWVFPLHLRFVINHCSFALLSTLPKNIMVLQKKAVRSDLGQDNGMVYRVNHLSSQPSFPLKRFGHLTTIRH